MTSCHMSIGKADVCGTLASLGTERKSPFFASLYGRLIVSYTAGYELSARLPT